MNIQPHLNNSLVPSCIQTNVSLKDKNWFGTGGNAHYFAQPATAPEFQQVLEFAHHHHLAITVIGHGANVLISDEGITGLVIQPALADFTHDPIHHCVTVGAGASMHDLISFCLDQNLIGLEEFSGIPGTVGGSVYINLHYFEFLLEQFLLSARVIHRDTGMLEVVDRAWFNFGYNQSTLQEGKHYLVDATFTLTPATDLQVAFAHGRRQEIIRHRTHRYPTKNTCGSFFRNFLPHEVTVISNGKKMIYVAYYLDKIGVKGQLQHGNAIVSYQHANMIINQGAATSADIIGLARRMQEKVYEHFKLTPQPECRLLGFSEYPLLQ